MNIFRVLGFGTNWNRVEKNILIQRMWEYGIIVRHMTCLELFDFDIERFFTENDQGITKEWAYKVVLAFGAECPTLREFPDFGLYYSVNTLLPSYRQWKKNPDIQTSWELAYKWAVEYEKNRLQTIIANKEKQNKALEKEIKTMKEQMIDYQDQIKAFEIKDQSHLVAKDHEIAKLKELAAKQKLKLNQIRRKQINKLFKKNHQNLALEIENET